MRLLLLALLLSAAPGQDSRPDALADARAHYNAGRFEQAIARAEEARRQPGLAGAASLVIARAHLEQFRSMPAASHLDAARDALKQVDASRLSVRDRFEYLVGLGEALYLDDPPRFGAAAEFFELALGAAGPVDAAEREQVFEWWASSLDRHAQFGPAPERRAVYQRILRGAETERASNQNSAVGWYWLALATRGAEDPERAYSHAVAGWIRAPQLGERGVALRTDLDRLMTQVILPDLARGLTPDGDPRAALADLVAQWEELKKRWG